MGARISQNRAASVGRSGPSRADFAPCDEGSCSAAPAETCVIFLVAHGSGNYCSRDQAIAYGVSLTRLPFFALCLFAGFVREWLFCVRGTMQVYVRYGQESGLAFHGKFPEGLLGDGAQLAESIQRCIAG